MDILKEKSQVRLSDHIKISDPDNDLILYKGRGVSNKLNTENKIKDEEKNV